MTERNKLILNWLGIEQNDILSTSYLQPINNDASLRRYYRFHADKASYSDASSRKYDKYHVDKAPDNGARLPEACRCHLTQSTYIVMDSQVDQSLSKFITLAKQFAAWGLLVPEIYRVDLKLGLALIGDLGNDLYLDKLNVNTANALYLAALQELLMLQKQVVPANWSLPTMGVDYIQNKLEVFQQWFLQQHLRFNITSKVQQMLTDLEQLFCKVFAAQPQVLVHVDYHSRNLMALPVNRPGILDFQDAMLGPISYDLVSLLQDAYITWPRAMVEEWVINYQELAFAAKLINNKHDVQFIKYFDLVGLQRHLKNLGVFARLYHRDTKPQYLQNIPTLLDYILSTCSRYQELQALQAFFVETVVPEFTSVCL